MFNIDSTVKICNTKPSKILVLMLTVSIIFKKPSCMIMLILFFGKKIPNKWSNKDQIQPHNKNVILVSVQNFQNECSKCLGFLRQWLQRQSEWSWQILIPHDLQSSLTVESDLYHFYYNNSSPYGYCISSSTTLFRSSFGTGASNAVPRDIWIFSWTIRNKPFK